MAHMRKNANADRQIFLQNPEAGSVRLSDGSIVTGDLVVAADGVHTRAAAAVLGSNMPALPTQHLVYRFLIPTRHIAADPETAFFLEGADGQMKFFVGDGKRIVTYPCRE